MDFKDCIKFANESGFYYHTGKPKSVYKQLKNQNMREAEIPRIKF